MVTIKMTIMMMVVIVMKTQNLKQLVYLNKVYVFLAFWRQYLRKYRLLIMNCSIGVSQKR